MLFQFKSQNAYSRTLILIIGLAVIPYHSLAQDKRRFFLDEFQISANIMVPNENSSETGFGFGIGAYHTFRPQKMLNLLLGLEYNRISQVIDFIHMSHLINAYDIALVADCMSLSFGPRFNIGTHTKVFFDTGIYADLVLKSQKSGTKVFCYHDEEDIICADIPVKEDVRLSHTKGIYIGTGLRIPISKIELIVSADYRYGLKPTAVFHESSVIYHRYFRLKLGVRFN
jgi:hypothetical protein